MEPSRDLLKLKLKKRLPNPLWTKRNLKKISEIE
jgi:hypothetical protein